MQRKDFQLIERILAYFNRKEAVTFEQLIDKFEEELSFAYPKFNSQKFKENCGDKRSSRYNNN